MNELGIFSFGEYKSYLRERLRTTPYGGHGAKTALASKMGCQSGYLSQVLNGSSHLSLEQAESANQYFHHTRDEAHFFLLLVQHSRAGSSALKSYFKRQIEEAVQMRSNLKSRFRIQEGLPEEAQNTYYSSWHYAAVHIALTVQRLRSADKISAYLGIPLRRVTEILDFLVGSGLALTKLGGLEVGKERIHLGADSPLIGKHHSHWRVRALQELESIQSKNLHYSSVVSISENDAKRVKSLLIETIERSKKIIRESPGEGVYCISQDLFELDSGR